jgi:hypothetical protein
MKRLFFLLLIAFVSCSFSQNKWIVVTTINYPTKALKKLASLNDWQLVVVGDKKTPQDWQLDNCHFLSAAEQENLPYLIKDHLPWNHYSRKVLGYLYAIEHGAEIIYETDDDNLLYDSEILFLPHQVIMPQISSNLTSINVYRLFGQDSVWPRGFPLSQITAPLSISTNVKSVHPYIQQSLADGDPDVDAIFRLTRQGEIYFSRDHEPVVLKAGNFCPFNTQNTVFHYEAFWGLYIPLTTSFRVCDIWRGYMMQRLLWDIDGGVCFTAPTVFQDRNEHNLKRDFADEIDLYNRAEGLIEFLSSWRSKFSSMPERITGLCQEMVAADFYKAQELDALSAWLQDLINLGYKFPEVSK